MNENHQKAFEKIKLEISKDLELYTPYFSKEFILETDASDIGLGCILKQDDHVVAYISRLLNGPEKNIA